MTSLTVTGMLSQKLGWDFYKALRVNDTMLSPVAQKISAENAIHSSRVDIAPPQGQPALSAVKFIPIDVDCIEKNGKDLKAKFNEISSRAWGDPKDAIEHAGHLSYPRNAARLVRQERLDGGPFIVSEFVSHDSRLRFGSLNHAWEASPNTPAIEPLVAMSPKADS